VSETLENGAVHFAFLTGIFFGFKRFRDVKFLRNFFQETAAECLAVKWGGSRFNRKGNYWKIIYSSKGDVNFLEISAK
jgi:hypothetical protein